VVSTGRPAAGTAAWPLGLPYFGSAAAAGADDAAAEEVDGDGLGDARAEALGGAVAFVRTVFGVPHPAVRARQHTTGNATGDSGDTRRGTRTRGW